VQLSSPDDRTKPARLGPGCARVVAITLGLFLGLVVAEIWSRTARWTPRSQIVRGHCLHSEDGIPVWGCESDPNDLRRLNRACVDEHPERIRILFFGSSITYGSGVLAEETFTTALQSRLNRARPKPGFCILNFARPGFQFEQKYAVARREVARYRPALIMWESWTEIRQYRIIGDTAYGISDYQLRPDGFIGVAGVPDWLNRLLFLHSRLYEQLALGYGERATNGLSEREAETQFVNERLIEVVRLAESVGAKLVIYVAPYLDRPFAESVASPSPSESILLEFSQTRGIPSYSLASELMDRDYVDLRLDPCCHYNPAGHEALVPVMERVILKQLAPANER
jgi:hypothetical protein